MRRSIIFSFLFGVGMHVFLGCASHESQKEGVDEHTISDLIHIPIDEKGNIDSTKLAQIYFPNSTLHFNTIFEGNEIVHVFPFVNMGNVPLVINNVTTSCGCTISSWTRQPVNPGSTGEIIVRFRTSGWPGHQTKTIHVSSNTIPAATKIYLEGYVQPDN